MSDYCVSILRSQPEAAGSVGGQRACIAFQSAEQIEAVQACEAFKPLSHMQCEV